MDKDSVSTKSLGDLLGAAPVNVAKYEALYKHFHAHPELSNLEVQTAKKVAEQLSQLQAFKITTDIGGHGLVGLMENGPGPTILLRADMDALPIKEATGLPYASTVTMADLEGTIRPVMHACGHDMHMTCLLAAAERLVKLKQEWCGTLIILFQPAEERGTGAKAMVDDGLYDKHRIPIPDFVLGQHVMAMRAGTVGTKTGTIMAGADSMKITLSGLGGHGSQPHRTVDPAVMAAHVVVRLQSIVSREISPSDISVITVGSLHAGQTENVISDSAEIGLDIRSVRSETREKLLASIRRVVEAECAASGATAAPSFKMTRHLPVTVNDDSMTTTLATSFKEYFGSDCDSNIAATTISEDFSVLATSQDTTPTQVDRSQAKGSQEQDHEHCYAVPFTSQRAYLIPPSLGQERPCQIRQVFSTLAKPIRNVLKNMKSNRALCGLETLRQPVRAYIRDNRIRPGVHDEGSGADRIN